MQKLVITLQDDDLVESQSLTVKLGEFPSLPLYLMAMYRALQAFGFTYIVDLKATKESGGECVAGDNNYLTLTDLSMEGLDIDDEGMWDL